MDSFPCQLRLLIRNYCSIILILIYCEVFDLVERENYTKSVSTLAPTACAIYDAKQQLLVNKHSYTLQSDVH